MLRSSRELSSRVEIRAHTHPNQFRRATWWLALWAGIGSLLWLSLQYVRGENSIYQAGPVTTPHRLVQNNCAACHSTWTPLQRLVSLSDDKHSVVNSQCETCHRVAAHHDNQVPAHRDISCAACHQEHKGAAMLYRPSNRHCIACHSDLKTTHGAGEIFAKHVTRFDENAGHPDFALHRLGASDVDGGDVSEKHPARKVLGYFLRPGEPAARWQDRGRVRFNHEKHLKAEYDANGQLIYGLIGKDRKFTDLSRSCETCHESDHERRFMQPINYERHCRDCHPLLFDNDRYPGQSVPHESPDIVRGFLTEVYTLRALRGDARLPKVAGDPVVEQRPIPGHRDFGRLIKDQAKTLLDEVGKAETLAQEHRHSLFGYEASGGCRYCHQVEPAAPQAPTSLADWRVVPPNIPTRWLLDGEFHHEPHRLLNCTACHAEVGSSKSTGDVLIPSIAVCRACHSQHPSDWVDGLPTAKSASESAKAGGEEHSLKELLSKSKHGARFNCVECHQYHNRAQEKLNGHFSQHSTDPASVE